MLYTLRLKVSVKNAYTVFRKIRLFSSCSFDMKSSKGVYEFRLNQISFYEDELLRLPGSAG